MISIFELRTFRLAATVKHNTNWNAIASRNINYININSSRRSGFAFAVRQLQNGRFANRRPRTSTSSATSKLRMSSKGRNKRSSKLSCRATAPPKQQPSSSSRRQKATLANSSSSRRRRQTTTTIRERTNRWLNQPLRIPVPRWINPEMVTFRYSECFGHLSFFLVAVSYAVDDFLHLRLIAIAGSSAMLVFTYFHPHGRILWLPFRWNCVFVALNSWRVAKVFLDHYWSAQLPPTIDALYENHHFGETMEKTDFAKLVRLGTLETYQEGDTLISQGCENRYVRLVVSGDLEVDRDGQTTYWLREGQFVSEMGLHAGLGLRGTVTSCCTVKAASSKAANSLSSNSSSSKSGTVTLLRWDRTELMHLLGLHKSIYRALKACMSWDIVSKLKSQRVLLASGKIDDPELWTDKRREQSLARYSAILQNMLAHPGYLNERKEKLARYREIHQVEESDHEHALDQIGWTISEFETGTKEGQLDEDALELQHLGWKWWFSSWWKAL